MRPALAGGLPREAPVAAGGMRDPASAARLSDPAAPLVLRLSARADEVDVRRLLGYRSGRAPARPVQARMWDLLARAPALLDPRGALAVLPQEAASHSRFPGEVEAIVLAACTIGGAPEAEALRLAEAGDVMGAMLLDAIGSAAVEAGACELDALACTAACERGLHAWRRSSPGYGAWPLSAQPALLALLPAAELGISLTAGLMMVPRKSITFGVPLLARPDPKRRPGSACGACPNARCEFRREPG